MHYIYITMHAMLILIIAYYGLNINNINTYSCENTIEIIEKFINGINLNRIQLEYNNFECTGKKLLKILFHRLYKEIPLEILTKISTKSTLAKILLFLNKQHLFTEKAN